MGPTSSRRYASPDFDHRGFPGLIRRVEGTQKSGRAPEKCRGQWMQEKPFSSYAFALLYVVRTGLYFLVFLAGYIVLRRIHPDPIVYYNGITILLGFAVFFIVCSAVGTFLTRDVFRRPGPWRLSFFPALVTFVLLAYAFVITIPSLLDRSISIYVIGTVAEAGTGGIAVEAIQESFLRGYVGGTQTVEKRLNEQLVTGNMMREGDRVVITPRGLWVHRTNLFLAGMLSIPDTYIMPK